MTGKLLVKKTGSTKKPPFEKRTEAPATSKTLRISAPMIFPRAISPKPFFG